MEEDGKIGILITKSAIHLIKCYSQTGIQSYDGSQRASHEYNYVDAK